MPGQGSLHFWFMHAKLFGHSLLLTHSGLQFGGTPTYCGKQEQDGEVPETLHWALGPHGEGLHGSIGTIGCSASSTNSGDEEI